MTTINYNAIVQEFEKALAVSNNTFGNDLIFKPEKHRLLKELHTVGLTLPRQMGTTMFIIEELIKDPNSYFVNVNNDYLSLSFSILKEMVRAANCNEKVSIRGQVYFDLKQDIKESILNQPSLLNNFKERLLTSKTLGTLIKDDIPISKNVSRIYFDGSVPIFKTIKRIKYYEWLSRQTDKCVQTWLIN
jgi:hypothetical protein